MVSLSHHERLDYPTFYAVRYQSVRRTVNLLDKGTVCHLEYSLKYCIKVCLRRVTVIVLSTIVGIILFVGGCAGVVLTWINYQVSSLSWIEGLLTYGMFTILGLGMIVFIVMTPREK